MLRIFTSRNVKGLNKLDILYWNNIERNLQNQEMTHKRVIQVYCQIQLHVIIKRIRLYGSDNKKKDFCAIIMCGV